MNIGIDLGTTNSALAYVAQAPGELVDYPEMTGWIGPYVFFSYTACQAY